MTVAKLTTAIEAKKKGSSLQKALGNFKKPNKAKNTSDSVESKQSKKSNKRGKKKGSSWINNDNNTSLSPHNNNNNEIEQQPTIVTKSTNYHFEITEAATTTSNGINYKDCDGNTSTGGGKSPTGRKLSPSSSDEENKKIESELLNNNEIVEGDLLATPQSSTTDSDTDKTLEMTEDEINQKMKLLAVKIEEIGGEELECSDEESDLSFKYSEDSSEAEETTVVKQNIDNNSKNEKLSQEIVHVKDNLDGNYGESQLVEIKTDKSNELTNSNDDAYHPQKTKELTQVSTSIQQEDVTDAIVPSSSTIATTVTLTDNSMMFDTNNIEQKMNAFEEKIVRMMKCQEEDQRTILGLQMAQETEETCLKKLRSLQTEDQEIMQKLQITLAEDRETIHQLQSSMKNNEKQQVFMSNILRNVTKIFKRGR